MKDRLRSLTLPASVACLVLSCGSPTAVVWDASSPDASAPFGGFGGALGPPDAPALADGRDAAGGTDAKLDASDSADPPMPDAHADGAPMPDAHADGAPMPDAHADGAIDAPRDDARDASVPDVAVDAAMPAPDARADTLRQDVAPDAREVAPDMLPDLPPPTGATVGCTESRTLWQGAETLLDVFPVADGVIIVRNDAIVRADRQGREVKVVKAARPLTAAAFDGTLLAAADDAFVTAYTTALEPRGSTTLVEPCVSSVMVSGQRFVCGPKNDWDRIFYTYDLVQRALLGSSMKHTYKGLHMRALAGSDFFVTLSDGSPVDVHLFRVDALGPAVYIGESPYHGDFILDRSLTSIGRPPTHLITAEGLRLRIFNDSCKPDSPPAFHNSSCMVKDGALGTLWPGERFLALTSDPQDRVYGLVADVRNTGGVSCARGCRVQQIDEPQRLVVGERAYHLPLGSVVASRHDDQCRMLVLAFRTNAMPPMYRVDLLEHGGP